MLTTGFSVQGTSLRLMRSHERGVITRIQTIRDVTKQRLRSMGLTLGQSVTIEQRFPRFIIRVGNHCHALDNATCDAIYVRIVED